jgi:hypothetical protein
MRQLGIELEEQRTDEAVKLRHCVIGGHTSHIPGQVTRCQGFGKRGRRTFCVGC